MSHCDSFYRALDKKLEQKMTIDDIATELCSKTKDPRRNTILDIKEHKGEDWLIANAKWLGYQVQIKNKQEQKQEQGNTKVASSCNVLSIAPLSTTSITSVVPEATVPDKIMTDVKKEVKLDIIPIVDSTLPKAEVYKPKLEIVSPKDVLTDQEEKKYLQNNTNTVSISIIETTPLIDTTSEIETRKLQTTVIAPIVNTIPKVNITPKVEKTLSIIEKVETIPIIQKISTMEIVNSIKKDDIGSISNISETNCRMGKTIPDCDICELGIYDEKWRCDDYNLLCGAQSCIVGKDIKDKRICSECGFKTNLKRIFWAHVKLVHKDNEKLIRQMKEEIKQFIIDQKMNNIVIRPFKYNCTNCGKTIETELGFDTKNGTFLTKTEIDNIRSFRSAPTELKEIINNINLKLI